MKALSLWQPWASAMALGLKAVETRHWTTSYRGPLAIHAAKRWTLDERELAQAHGLVDLPLGAIVATGFLQRIVPTTSHVEQIGEDEEQWGNYAPGRFAWVFVDIAALAEPIPFRGAQGFFEVPDELLGVKSIGKLL